jgi:hypothetical protein
MLISLSLPVGIEAIINDEFEKKLKLPLPIIATVMIFLSFVLLYDRPEFSPTMSEEDKIEMRRVRPFSFQYRQQLDLLSQNRGYILFAISAVLMLVNINEINSVLMIFNR